jgi:alpha-beta hydrolase superfamily lysophospholipase
MPSQSMIHNPHLEGEPFFWEAGPLGVLLIHGFTATTAEVRPLAKILHQNGYTVSGPLLPGHYTRPEDLNRVKWQDWVAEVETALHQLQAKCPTVFVGGESTGGLLALYLAARHPEVAGILAYAPALKLSASSYDLIPLEPASAVHPVCPQGEHGWRYPMARLPGQPTQRRPAAPQAPKSGPALPARHPPALIGCPGQAGYHRPPLRARNDRQPGQLAAGTGALDASLVARRHH